MYIQGLGAFGIELRLLLCGEAGRGYLRLNVRQKKTDDLKVAVHLECATKQFRASKFVNQ